MTEAERRDAALAAFRDLAAEREADATLLDRERDHFYRGLASLAILTRDAANRLDLACRYQHPDAVRADQQTLETIALLWTDLSLGFRELVALGGVVRQTRARLNEEVDEPWSTEVS